MGIHINPNPVKFRMDRASEIYVDKSMIIDVLNSAACTSGRYICVSRPRRFGKTMATDMIAAYYSRTTDAAKEFQGLKIAENESFSRYANQFDVIKLNMQDYLSASKDIDKLTEILQEDIEDELFEMVPEAKKREDRSLSYYLEYAFEITGRQFVFVVDEWDCIFREYPHDSYSQKKYLDFLRDLFKDKGYIALCYMTGILPIKKYGSQSALNMFTEYSMENPGVMALYTGFTETEVQELCTHFHVDMDTCRQWYDGYSFTGCDHVYNPKSICAALISGVFDDYWNKTETYEALRSYIDMNFDGLRDSIVKMLAGERQKINTGSFQNDMTTFETADDVLTLLVHLGYLGYDFEAKEASIPNREIAGEFVTATTAQNRWSEVINSVSRSDELLQATWAGNEEKVASIIEQAHLETSRLQYNDENALSYTIFLAYYAARQYYTIVRELPSRNGFADLAFLPRRKYPDKPAMIIELKWDHAVNTAIDQILERKYPEGLNEYAGSLLLVGISYRKEDWKHECRIMQA